jgi:hypothetical protein
VPKLEIRLRIQGSGTVRSHIHSRRERKVWFATQAGRDKFKGSRLLQPFAAAGRCGCWCPWRAVLCCSGVSPVRPPDTSLRGVPFVCHGRMRVAN